METRMYVDVISLVKTTGDVVPLFMYWDSDNDRVKLKVGRPHVVSHPINREGGVCYKCVINQKPCELFLQDGRWFVKGR